MIIYKYVYRRKLEFRLKNAITSTLLLNICYVLVQIEKLHGLLMTRGRIPPLTALLHSSFSRYNPI
jgi:hypothetical protein